MKTLKLTLLVVSIFAFTLQSANAKEEYKKNIKESFDISKDAKLVLKNKFGKIHCENWDKNSISIEVEITVDASNQEKANKYFEKINVDIKGNLFSNINNKEDIKIGKLAIKNFSGDNSLRAVGRNVFVPSEGATPNDATDYNIFNGFIETSNVRLEEEMTEMIVTQRAFQVNATSIKTADEMWGLVNNMFK